MAKPSKKWSSEVIIKFLEAYEQHPCLWNYKLSSYKDRNQREEALRRIVEVMSDSVFGFDEVAAKAKIRSIRNAYTLERHKVLNSYKSGTGAIYKPTVGWFSVANRFLNGIVETRDAKSTLEWGELQGDVEESEESEEHEISFYDFYRTDAEETSADGRSAPSTSNQSTPSPQKTTAKKKSMSIKEEPAYKKTKFVDVDAVNPLPEVAQEPDALTSDEFEAFAKVVVAHLRQLPLNSALESQSDILHYLVQKRLGRRVSFSLREYS